VGVKIQFRAIRELIDERDKRYEQRFAASEMAVKTAGVAQAEKFEAHNGLLNMIQANASATVPRLELDLRLGAIERSIDELQKERFANQGGRLASARNLSLIQWLFGALVALGSIVLLHYWGHS
jgi:hypothetical protein